MSEERNKNSALMRYAGLATQWLVVLGLAVWGGIKLDARLHLKALFVIVLPVIALAYSFWSLLRSLNNKTDKY